VRFSSVQRVDRVIVAPFAHLTNANLSGADLRNAVLTGADLTGVIGYEPDETDDKADE
jgi:uncharacterized protein YjbI with pentapeptide repeats